MLPRFHKTLAVAIALAIIPCALAVDLTQCNLDVQARLANRTLRRTDPIFFFNGSTYMSNPSDLRLTIDGCRKTCPRQGVDFYRDIGPRLTTWLIPVLLLIGNMHFPRLGALNYLFVVVHLLGDPIDSMWSLLVRAEAWNRFYLLAEQNRQEGDKDDHVREKATLLAAIDELDGGGRSALMKLEEWQQARGPQSVVVPSLRVDPPPNDAGLAHPVESISAQVTRLSRDDLKHIFSETSEELGDCRSNETIRAGLAIFSYFYAVTAGFVEALGGKSSSPPGGRIGTAMFLSWLVTAVLLSNAMSGFTSRRTCLRILERCERTCGGFGHQGREESLLCRLRYSRLGWGNGQRFYRSSWTNFHDSQPWLGAIYTYRPNKRLFSIHSPGSRNNPSLYYRLFHSRWALLLLSILPILLASTTASTVIWYVPTTGFTCRHVYVVTITTLWLLSALITQVTWDTLATGKYHWYITLAKDAVIAVPSMTVVMLSSCGLFNTCFCWGAPFSSPKRRYVLLDPSQLREHNAHTIYAYLVWGCLGLHCLTFALMLWIMRSGSHLLRRDEDQKMRDFYRAHDHRIEIETSGEKTTRHNHHLDRRRGDDSMDAVDDSIELPLLRGTSPQRSP